MGCPACARKKKGDGYAHFEALQYPPFNASDIQVYDNGNVHRLNADDWTDDRHKLVLFYPSLDVSTHKDLDDLIDWNGEFDKLGCDLYIASTDPVHVIKDFLQANPTLRNSNIKALSSYLLPTRLNIMHAGRCMHASVFITKEADVVIQHHFLRVDRSLSELHRMMFGYAADSQHTSDWHDPKDKFAAETEKNDGAKKS